MKKRMVLSFPLTKVNEPVTYKLIKDFDILVNIINADITPGKEGKLLVELKAPRENIEKAEEYFDSLNIQYNPVMKSILLNQEKCIHCGSCSAVCFADALHMDQESRELIFKPEKCIACELCITACPLQLFEINFSEHV